MPPTRIFRSASWELTDARRSEIDRLAVEAAKRFSAARRTNNRDELKALAANLERFRTLKSDSEVIEQSRLAGLRELDAWQAAELETAFAGRLEALGFNPTKPLNSEQARKLRELLDEKPPALTADLIQKALGAYAHDYARAERQFALARQYAGAGAPDEAQEQLVLAGSVPAGDAFAAQAAELRTALAAQLAEANALKTQTEKALAANDRAGALKAAEKLLALPPPVAMEFPARELFWAAGGGGTISQFAPRMAKAREQYATDPAAARTAQTALLAEGPYSRETSSAILDLNIRSVPPGAAVTVNDRPQANPAPVTALVPATGLTVITATLEGYEPAVVVRRNLRDAEIELKLVPLPGTPSP